MASILPAITEERREPRLEVLHRTRVVHQNGVEQPVTVVNVSAGGFMARGDGEWAVGDRISILLPSVGLMKAEVRWGLGGRIGCQFTRTLSGDAFHSMLQFMRRSIG